MGRTFYAVRSSWINGADHTIYMHRVLLDPVNGQEVDHVNGNGLDNREENLRIVTHRKNQQNQHRAKTSRFVGVSWFKNLQKWRAAIYEDGVKQHLGLFNEEIDAATAYQTACGKMEVV